MVFVIFRRYLLKLCMFSRIRHCTFTSNTTAVVSTQMVISWDIMGHFRKTTVPTRSLNVYCIISLVLDPLSVLSHWCLTWTVFDIR